MTRTHRPEHGSVVTVESPARTMRAVVRDEYGTADVLRVAGISRPVPAADELLVRVAAAGLDRGAWHVMTGRPYLMRVAGFGLRRPKKHGLGAELSGVVEAVGAGVTDLAVGDAVFGVGVGTFAEYAVARRGKVARTPSTATSEQAAATPISGLTALQALRDRGAVQAGQHVLVIGASGGVGTFAVQIAKALGAQVTGVCSAAKADLVRSLGADHVIDYATGDLGDGSTRFDVILDIAGNRSIRSLRRLLTPKGTLVLVGGERGGRVFGGMQRQLLSLVLTPFIGQRLRPFLASENNADLEVLRGYIESGAVTPVVDRTYSLAEVPAAMADLEAGRIRGKAVVTP